MNAMIALFAKLSGFGWIAKKLDGYKTKIGAISLMLSGLAEITQKIVGLSDLASIISFLRTVPMEPGWIALSAGFAAWGMAKKMEKAAAAPPVP